MNKHQQIELAIMDAVSTLRHFIPKDTGNMRYNAFKIEPLGDMKWKIFIDEKVAPYVVYVNEKWVSPKWNGKTNPNEGFWQYIVKRLADMIATAINGKIKWSY